MNTFIKQTRQQSLQDPFAAPLVSGRGFATASVVAVAYAVLFTTGIVRNDVSPERGADPDPVVVAEAAAPEHWGLEIRLAADDVMVAESRTNVGEAIRAQGRTAIEAIQADARRGFSLASLQVAVEPVPAPQAVQVAANPKPCVASQPCPSPKDWLEGLLKRSS